MDFPISLERMFHLIGIDGPYIGARLNSRPTNMEHRRIVLSSVDSLVDSHAH